MLVDKEEFLKNKKDFIKKIKAGSIFIYPTDTIYGLGCLASDKKAVKKIEAIKKRKNQPFSIIVTKSWIKENCILKKGHRNFLDKLPGPYTLILRLKNGGTIGIRIPNHWFLNIIKETGPIITTSVNITGKPFMTCLKDADKNILKKVDFTVYEGKKISKPSTLIHLIDEAKIIKRS